MSERRGTKALELWCRRMTEGYPGVKIDNMTTSWRDGLAFCAMIHHFRPDLIDFEKLDKSDIYYNNALAFTTAEKYLGIPALLDADDMAAYEVPDRLSILTYLSQFYQAFAAQEAHNRLKRTSSSSATDKAQLTKSSSSGPPPKMAHVVGVPKRDPCRKCQLPVFLAERLMVGKKVYHRTCLKCARCGYQLTPGSFYETEVDEQYCCETCPDEEISKSGNELVDNDVAVGGCSDVELRNSKVECENNSLLSPVKSVRGSIRDRLAFFENQRDQDESDRKLLQKSLSDEEKSKSLQRMESPSCNVAETTYKPNVALTNFLQNSADNEEELSETYSSLQNSKMETSDSDSDDTDDLTNISLPPELPKSLPPMDMFKEEKKSEEQKRFSVSTQLVLGSSQDTIEETISTKTAEADKEQNTIREPIELTSELQINLSSNIIVDKTNNNDTNNDKSITEVLTEEQRQEETVQLQPNKLESNLEFSKTNDNCITKDNSADAIVTEKTIENTSQLYETEDDKQDINMLKDLSEANDVPDNEPIKEDMVELRTQPDEANLDVSLQSEDKETTERLSVVRDRLQKFEVIANNENINEYSPQLQEHIVHDEILTNKKELPKPIKNESITLELSESTVGAEIQDDNINIPTENEIEKDALINDKVPLRMETKDNEILESNIGNKQSSLERINSKESIDNIPSPQKNTNKITIEEYPEDLNPFKSDEEDQDDMENNKENVESKTSKKKLNLNPFDSSDDEVELEKDINLQKSINSTPKIPPPRPPPPRISKNPFGSDEEDDNQLQNFQRRTSLTGSQSRKTPVPTPRSNISQSQNPTPEPTPRFSTKSNTTISISPTTNNSSITNLQNSCDYYGSSNSLHSSNTTPHHLLRNSDVRSSSNSLNLSAGGTIRSRKSRRAPLPPAPVKELFPSNETINSSSKTSTPSSSTVGTPKSARKKRPAPAPPKPARLEASQVSQHHIDTISTQPKNLNSYPLQSELDSKLSDEEKALLEGKTLQSLHSNESNITLSPSVRRSSKRLIPLDKELLEEHGSLQYQDSDIISQCDDLKQQNQQKSSPAQEEEQSVVYRRLLIPQNLETPTHEHNPFIEDLSKSPTVGERQLEKLKDNKEANNRNRQSQISVASSGGDDNDPLFNKSAHGKWKRRKGPAPALPIPPRKVLQMLPLQEIKHELEIIEVQQQGLEKQGVILEKMIRDRCEGENGEPLNTNATSGECGESGTGPSTENSKEVENLILQLFELVNEKNELFRRQAELMYLRRQHRLEQEQADLEYEIRILMAQPERNKTDSDKAREEALIERLVEVVKLRNEVVECLEMDRLREAEEDQSIKQRLESHIAKRDDDSNSRKTLTKLSKKEKKKQKEAKKLSKSKKLDADKDADESELNMDKQKSKKKKKLLIF